MRICNLTFRITQFKMAAATTQKNGCNSVSFIDLVLNFVVVVAETYCHHLLSALIDLMRA